MTSVRNFFFKFLSDLEKGGIPSVPTVEILLGEIVTNVTLLPAFQEDPRSRCDKWPCELWVLDSLEDKKIKIFFVSQRNAKRSRNPGQKQEIICWALSLTQHLCDVF